MPSCLFNRPAARALAGLALLWVCAAPGCSSRSLQKPGSDSPRLEETTWQLEELDGRPLQQSGFWKIPTLRLDTAKGVAVTRGPCNNGSGSYSLQADSLTLKVRILTAKGCLPKQAEIIEDRFYDVLREFTGWTIRDNLLDLRDDKGQVIARFSAHSD